MLYRVVVITSPSIGCRKLCPCLLPWPASKRSTKLTGCICVNFSIMTVRLVQKKSNCQSTEGVLLVATIMSMKIVIAVIRRGNIYAKIHSYLSYISITSRQSISSAVCHVSRCLVERASTTARGGRSRDSAIW